MATTAASPTAVTGTHAVATEIEAVKEAATVVSTGKAMATAEVEVGSGEAVAAAGGRPPSGGGPTSGDNVRDEGETAGLLLQAASLVRRGADAWDRVADAEASSSSWSIGPRSAGGPLLVAARSDGEPGRLVRIGYEASARMLQALAEGDAAEAELEVARKEAELAGFDYRELSEKNSLLLERSEWAEDQLAATRVALAAVQGKLAAGEKALQQAEAARARMETAMKKLRSERDKAVAAADTAERQMSEAHEARRQLDVQLSSTQRQLAESEQRRIDAEGAAAAVSADFANLRREHQELGHAFNKESEEHDELRIAASGVFAQLNISPPDTERCHLRGVEAIPSRVREIAVEAAEFGIRQAFVSAQTHYEAFGVEEVSEALVGGFELEQLVAFDERAIAGAEAMVAWVKDQEDFPFAEPPPRPTAEGGEAAVVPSPPRAPMPTRAPEDPATVEPTKPAEEPAPLESAAGEPETAAEEPETAPEEPETSADDFILDDSFYIPREAL